MVSYLLHKVNVAQILNTFTDNCKSHVVTFTEESKGLECLLVFYLETVKIPLSLQQLYCALGIFIILYSASKDDGYVKLLKGNEKSQVYIYQPFHVIYVLCKVK